jgi:hypothetical protein
LSCWQESTEFDRYDFPLIFSMYLQYGCIDPGLFTNNITSLTGLL